VVPGINHGSWINALLSFTSDDSRRDQREVRLLVDAHGESDRLGRDILNRWLMVFDPANGTLLIEPLPDAP
jgi:hypothetical protein